VAYENVYKALLVAYALVHVGHEFALIGLARAMQRPRRTCRRPVGQQNFQITAFGFLRPLDLG
jgi:hypothetical protein